MANIKHIASGDTGLDSRVKINLAIDEANKVDNKLNSSTVSGGSVNQILRKNSGTDYDFLWVTGGDGTVTSVGLSAPTGFSVSSSPITSSGTIALSFASGYSLPTNAKQSEWDTAYSFASGFNTNYPDLYAIESLSGLTGILKKTALNTWELDNTIYTDNDGTVTSVSMTVPLGLSISGTPITESGTLALTYTSGYSIPLDSDQSNWDAAYDFADNFDVNHPDITSIESISGTSGLLRKTGVNTWSLDTNTYLTSYTETDTLQSVTSRGSATTANITAGSFIKSGGTSSQFLKANGGVDSNTYLTSFTETDPIFTASEAYSITSTDTTNWDAAYNWGDHSTVGYLTSVDISDINATGTPDSTTYLKGDGTWSTFAGTTVSFGVANQIPFTNATVDDFDYSSSFTWSGSTLYVGGNVTLTGTVDGRDIAIDGTNQDSHIANSLIHVPTDGVEGEFLAWDGSFIDIADYVGVPDILDYVLAMQEDATLDPGVSPTTGDRYIILDSTNLHANFGTITGVGDDDIVEFTGTVFEVSFDASAATASVEVTVTIDINSNTDRQWYYSIGGSEWRDRGITSTENWTRVSGYLSPTTVGDHILLPIGDKMAWDDGTDYISGSADSVLSFYTNSTERLQISNTYLTSNVILKVDEINEVTANNGIDIDGVIIKDSKVTVDTLYIDNVASYITEDVSNNLTFTDIISGTATLAELLNSNALTFGLENQIPVTNSTTDDFDYDANFIWDGTKLGVAGDIELEADNDKLIFGTGDDIEMYFSGTKFILDSNNEEIELTTNPNENSAYGKIYIDGDSGYIDTRVDYDGNGTDYAEIHIEADTGDSRISIGKDDTGNGSFYISIFNNTCEIVGDSGGGSIFTVYNVDKSVINRVVKTPSTLTSSTAITIDMDNGYQNFYLSLAHNATITFSNLAAGDEGNIVVDNTGSYTLAISPTPKVINDGAGVVTLTSSGRDIISYYYDGTYLNITYGSNYTNA